MTTGTALNVLAWVIVLAWLIDRGTVKPVPRA